MPWWHQEINYHWLWRNLQKYTSPSPLSSHFFYVMDDLFLAGKCDSTNPLFAVPPPFNRRCSPFAPSTVTSYKPRARYLSAGGARQTIVKMKIRVNKCAYPFIRTHYYVCIWYFLFSFIRAICFMGNYSDKIHITALMCGRMVIVLYFLYLSILYPLSLKYCNDN